MLSGRPLDSVTEDEQYAIYRSLIEQVAPRPVTIRTFDLDERQVGRDQQRPRAAAHAARACAACGSAWPIREVLRTQLRALVRASAHGPLRIMFPFVTGGRGGAPGARDAAATCARRASARHRVKVGAMIEVPSAALAADLLAPRSRLLHDRHQRSDPVHAWPSIAPTIACRISTSRCIPPCSG